MQRRRDGLDCLVDQRALACGVEVLGEDAAQRGDSDIDGGVAQVRHRLLLFERDLLDGLAAAAFDRGLDILGAWRGETLRFGLGLRDDALGFLQRIALAALELGELGLRLVAQPLGFVELGLDLGRAVIEPRR